MTASELQARVLERLDEDASGGFYTGAEALEALNAGQRMFVLLTLCLETTGPLALDAGVTWYQMLTEFPNFLLPLRVRVAGTGGAKLLPKMVTALDALNETWQAAAGAPLHYACLGFDLFAVHPQPAAGGTSLDVTYARCPAAMTAGATPEIPEEYHPGLVDFAVPWLRVKEGGQEFRKSLAPMDRFLDGAAKMAGYVRARGKAQRYDRLPAEWERWDRGKLVSLAMRRMKPAWLANTHEQVENTGRAD